MDYRHRIIINKDSKLFQIIGKEEIEVNSIHSMVATQNKVNKIGIVSAQSEDGYVESFEIPNKKFVVGIKWHPELMLEEEYVNMLFKRFIESC